MTLDSAREGRGKDKNGLFEYDPNDGNGQPLVPGSLVPEGPHGHQMEVTAANVAREDVLFPAESMAELDATCGASRPLRACDWRTRRRPVKSWRVAGRSGRATACPPRRFRCRTWCLRTTSHRQLYVPDPKK